MIMFRNLHSKLWTKQLLKRIQISRTAPTTLSCLAMSVCPTTSATTAPSSLTVLVLLTSGSPLVCPSKYDPDTYVQAGMVAWGIGCGEDGTPGVYASVSKALCW